MHLVFGDSMAPVRGDGLAVSGQAKDGRICMYFRVSDNIASHSYLKLPKQKSLNSCHEIYFPFTLQSELLGSSMQDRRWGWGESR